MNQFANLDKPIIFAHRGASKYAPENTLAAFRLAADQGVSAIELDVKLTRDNEVIVIHDQNLLRTTGVHGDVKQFYLEEIKEFDAGSYFSAEFRDERIPTLGEVFNEIGQKLLINVELTNYSTPNDSLVEKVVEVIKRYNIGENVFFSSFDLLNLKKIQKYLPEIPVAVLALPGIAGLINRSWIGKRIAPQIIHPHYKNTSAEFIQAQHRNGRRVHSWTVNDETIMKQLFLSGIDGIFTDDPILAREVLTKI